jgi:DNA-binding response OmpR family regulator
VVALRALIVDDEAVVREIFRIHLEQWGFEVSVASDMPGAAYLTRSGRYDVVLADRELPDGRVLEVLERAGRSGSRPALILMAEDWPEAEQRAAREAGAVTIYRPCDWDELRRIIGEQLGTSLANGVVPLSSPGNGP